MICRGSRRPQGPPSSLTRVPAQVFRLIPGQSTAALGTGAEGRAVRRQELQVPSITETGGTDGKTCCRRPPSRLWLGFSQHLWDFASVVWWEVTVEGLEASVLSDRELCLEETGIVPFPRFPVRCRALTSSSQLEG